MAIQLNERDYQIFKLLDEHQVLLEKHISWFVSTEEKPVLIRDRLRKLFYLDYLICQRHDSKLPWWTTPTKPLVYMLAPLARTISGASQSENNPYDNDWQQKHLEIANIRMIFLIAQKEGLLNSLKWQTCADNTNTYDAVISFKYQSIDCNVGLMSHPNLNEDLSVSLKDQLNNSNITHTIIVSRHKAHQESLQKSLIQLKSDANVNSILFATHQDLYKSGLAKVRLNNVINKPINFPLNSVMPNCSANFGTIEAA
jgi:hypothetical protein